MGVNVVFGGSNFILRSSPKKLTKLTAQSLSRTEAEYCCVVDPLAELEWIKSVLLEMVILVPYLMVVWCENTSEIALSKNPTHYIKLKHVAMKYHFI